MLLEREQNVLKINSCWVNYLCTTAATWHDIQILFFLKRGPLFDFTASRLSHLNLLYSQQLVLMIWKSCAGDRCYSNMMDCSLLLWRGNEGGKGWVRRERERERGGGSGREMVSAVVFSSQRMSPFSAVTHNQNLPLLLAVVSSLRLIWGWWQGAVALPGALEGVMIGGQWPRAPGGRFVGGDSLLLM